MNVLHVNPYNIHVHEYVVNVVVPWPQPPRGQAASAPPGQPAANTSRLSKPELAVSTEEAYK